MTIEEFWNKAFIASLGRVDAHRAKIQADEATQLCIEHWKEHYSTWVTCSASWKDQQVGSHASSNPISRS